LSETLLTAWLASNSRFRNSPQLQLDKPVTPMDRVQLLASMPNDVVVADHLRVPSHAWNA
jgi:hypothetical protein